MTRPLCIMGLLLGLLTLSGCDARTAAQGRVVSNDGHAIAGASVRLVDQRSGKAVETNSRSDGSYNVTRIHGVFSGPFKLIVTKTGYVTFEREIQAKEQNKLDVTLTAVGEK